MREKISSFIFGNKRIGGKMRNIYPAALRSTGGWFRLRIWRLRKVRRGAERERFSLNIRNSILYIYY
jgi:hypothetical protein